MLVFLPNCCAKLQLQAEEEGGVPAAAPSKAALKRARKKAAADAAAAAAAAATSPETATGGATGGLIDTATHDAAPQPDGTAAAAAGAASAQSSMQRLRLQNGKADSSVPAESRAPVWMICPLTHAILADPVVCTGDGQTYERSTMMQWLAASDVSPVTGQPLVSRDLLPNHALRSIIQAAQARPS